MAILINDTSQIFHTCESFLLDNIHGCFEQQSLYAQCQNVPEFKLLVGLLLALMVFVFVVDVVRIRQYQKIMKHLNVGKGKEQQ